MMWSGDDARDGPRGRRRTVGPRVAWLSSALLAAAMVAASCTLPPSPVTTPPPAPSPQAPAVPSGNQINGTVVELAGDTLLLKDSTGDLRLEIGNNTTITTPGGGMGTRNDLKPGARVEVQLGPGTGLIINVRIA